VFKCVLWAVGMAVLAGCGGGFSAPPLLRTSAPSTPQSGTLYVANASMVEAFPLGATDPAPPSLSLTGFFDAGPGGKVNASIGAIGAGPGQTVVVGTNVYPSPSVVGCRFAEYATTATSSSDFRSSVACPNPPEQTSIAITARSIVENANGAIDYVSFDDKVYRLPPNGAWVVRLQATGASDVFGMTEDSAGNIYLARGSPNRVEVYQGTADIAAPATFRTVALPGSTDGPIAVASDGTIYVAYFTTSTYVAAIDTSGRTLRTIGPLVGTAGGLAVDAGGELYVALNQATTIDFVQVYASNANGGVAPIRELTMPIPAGVKGGSAIVGLAVAQ